MKPLRYSMTIGLLLFGAAHAVVPRANDVVGNLVKNGSMDYGGLSTLGATVLGAPDQWTKFGGTLVGSAWWDPTNIHNTINEYLVSGHGDTRVLPYSPEGDKSYTAGVHRGGEAKYYQNDTHGFQQTIGGLILGHTYQLSFWAAASSSYLYGDSTWRVRFLGATFDTTNLSVAVHDDRTCYGYIGNNTSYCVGGTGPINDKGEQAGRARPGVWKQYTTTFTANATSSNLAFSTLMPYVDATPFNYNMVLDSVVLQDTAPVPEPAKVALLLGGLGILVWRLRRSPQA